jgi:hypothetical protein
MDEAKGPRARAHRIEPPAPARVLIVRRGQAGVYEQLAALERYTGVPVLWDRRVRERRVDPRPVALERRRRDRRRSPPATWTTMGYVLAVSMARDSR